MELTTGQILIQRYVIKGLIGQGGMGAVYQAHDPVLDREVAIKQLAFDPHSGEQPPEQLRQQFLHEARTLANLNHPNLPRVTDFFEHDGLYYLVMDYIAGTSLQAVLQHKGDLDQDRVLNWADQLLSALEYIHKHNLIHRDIKPANIRLTADGHIFLVDFGLVKKYDVNNPNTLTLIHSFGTLEYAPPEQYDPAGHTDQRSDLYALGATLYHLLSGRAPVTVTRRIAEPAAFQPLHIHNASISPEIEQVIGRAMELARENRFASAADMRLALRHARQRTHSGSLRTLNLAEQPPVSADATVAAPPERRRKRRMALVGAMGIVGVLFVIIFGVINRPDNAVGGSVQTPTGNDLNAAQTLPLSLTMTVTLTPTTSLSPATFVSLSPTPAAGTATSASKPSSGGQAPPTAKPTRAPPGQVNHPTPHSSNDNNSGGNSNNGSGNSSGNNKNKP
jgi:serine/threonine protein kinase